MSVINQMLKDLESRKEQGDALPQPDFTAKKSGAGRWLILLVILALLLGAAYWFWQDSQTQEQQRVPLVVVNQASKPAVAIPQPDAKKTTEEPQPEVMPKPQFVAAKSEPEEALEAEEPKPTGPVIQSKPSRLPEPLVQAEPEPQMLQPEVQAEAPVPPEPQKAPAKAKIQLHKMSPEEVAVAQLKQARQAHAAGQLQQAEASYQTVLRMKPAQQAARAELAQLYLQQQRLNDAWQQAELGIRFHPKVAEFYRVKAQVLHLQGQQEGAWQTLEQVGDSEFLSNDFLMLKAGLANQLGRYELAYILYVRLSERAPESGRWWFGRALSAEYLARPDEAKACYHKALQSADLSSASRTYATHRMQRLGAL